MQDSKDRMLTLKHKMEKMNIIKPFSFHQFMPQIFIMCLPWVPSTALAKAVARKLSFPLASCSSQSGGRERTKLQSNVLCALKENSTGEKGREGWSGRGKISLNRCILIWTIKGENTSGWRMNQCEDSEVYQACYVQAVVRKSVWLELSDHGGAGMMVKDELRESKD